MRHREGSARRPTKCIWRADGTSFPAEYLEPPDPPQRRGDRRRRHVPRRHRAAARRAGDPGRRAAARAVPRDAVARAAQSAGRHPERHARARQRGVGRSTRARRPARSSTRQANHMSRLLDDLLDVARITRGRIILRNELVDLRDTARAAIEALAPVHGRARDATAPSTSPDEPRAGLRRSGAAAADAGEPAQQRVEVLTAGRAACASTLRREGDEAVHPRQRRGPRHRAGRCCRGSSTCSSRVHQIARALGGWLGIGLTLLRSLVELHHGRVEAAQRRARAAAASSPCCLPLAPHVGRSRRGRGAAAPAERQDRGARRGPDRCPPDDAAAARSRRRRGPHRPRTDCEGAELHRADPTRSRDRRSRPAGDERLRPGAPDPDAIRAMRRMRLVALSGYGQDSDIQAALDAGLRRTSDQTARSRRLDALLHDASTRPDE